MRILKKSYLSLCLVLSSTSYAASLLDLTVPQLATIADGYPSYSAIATANFNDTGENSSIFGLKSKSNKREQFDTIYAARIKSGSSRAKEIRIYYPAPACSDKGKRYSTTTTVSTNGRPVSYTKFCDGQSYYLLPSHIGGHNYLVDEFKRKKDVGFEFNSEIVMFDATGFTKAWENFKR